MGSTLTPCHLSERAEHRARYIPNQRQSGGTARSAAALGRIVLAGPTRYLSFRPLMRFAGLIYSRVIRSLSLQPASAMARAAGEIAAPCSAFSHFLPIRRWPASSGCAVGKLVPGLVLVVALYRSLFVASHPENRSKAGILDHGLYKGCFY